MVPTMLPMNPNVNGSLWKKRKSSKKIKIKVKNSLIFNGNNNGTYNAVNESQCKWKPLEEKEE